MDESRLSQIITGIFLLVLGMYAAWITQATGCPMQQFMSEHMLPRHLVIFLIIFFAIDFTQQSGDKNKPRNSPLRSLWEAAVIYVLFLLYSRTTLPFTLASFALLGVLLFLSRFITYYREQHKDVAAAETAQLVLCVLAALLILTGFGLYLRKQLREHGDEWSTVDFVFGKRACAHQLPGTPVR